MALLTLCRAPLRFPGGASGKGPTCQGRRQKRLLSLIPGSGRSPGGGRGNPLHYSCLENAVGRGAWRTAVHRVELQRVTNTTEAT